MKINAISLIENEVLTRMNSSFSGSYFAFNDGIYSISRGESYNILNRFFVQIELSTDYYTLIYMLFNLYASVFENVSQFAHKWGLYVKSWTNLAFLKHFLYFANIIKFYCVIFTIEIDEFNSKIIKVYIFKYFLIT